ncbi:Pycsar system effector family protein [Micromonospora haikouensis]|uniref:Pycsar system effector family protein n=1 Tax=Micromonospora haikouensis TaxID=686309 RepID=UPI003D71F485
MNRLARQRAAHSRRQQAAAHLEKKRATGEAHLARCDQKASTLLGQAGTVLPIGLAVLTLTDLPRAAVIVAVCGVALVAVSVPVLGAVIQPSLRGDHDIVRDARRTPDDVWNEALNGHDELRHEAAASVWQARAAVRKYRRVQVGLTLLVAGFVCMAIATIISILTRPGGTV